MRFTQPELDLLDAWTDYLGSASRPLSRSDVVVRMLLRMARPTELSPEARAVRVAYEAAVKLDP